MALSFCTSGQGESGGGNFTVDWGGNKGKTTTNTGSKTTSTASSGNTTSTASSGGTINCQGAYGCGTSYSDQMRKAQEDQAAAQENARKAAEEKKQKDIEETNAYYQSLMDILTSSDKQAEILTEKNALKTAGSNALTNQVSALATGLNKSMAASLGNATLQSDTETSYLDTIGDNRDAAYKDALQKVILSLEARGDKNTANNIEEAGTALKGAQTAADWSNAINTLGQGARDYLNSKYGDPDAK